MAFDCLRNVASGSCSRVGMGSTNLSMRGTQGHKHHQSFVILLWELPAYCCDSLGVGRGECFFDHDAFQLGDSQRLVSRGKWKTRVVELKSNVKHRGAFHKG